MRSGSGVETSTFYYPGWTVTIDGVPASVSPAPVAGTMRFELPAGEHRVVIELRPTRLRRAAMVVTALTSLLLVALAFMGLPFARSVFAPIHPDPPR